jgi:hypothetical protein
MARSLWWVPVILVLATSGSIAPVKGARTLSKVRIERKSHMEFKEAFQGGRRACVIAVGDHNPPVDVGIAVFDEAGQLVTEHQGLDYVAAIWYPPRTASYKIVVKNTGLEYNAMYLVFK